jgi:hypothetical protein
MLTMNEMLCAFVILAAVSSAECNSRENPPEQKSENAKALQDNGPRKTVTGPNGHFMRFVEHRVIDKEGTGLPAATYLLPEGWTVKDRLYWDYQDIFHPARYVGQYQSGDGALRTEYFANVGSIWSTGPAGTQGIRPPASVIEALKGFIPYVRTVARLRFTGAKKIPTPRQMVQQGGATGQTDFESGMVRIEYEQNGRPVEEEFYADYSVVRAASQGVVYLETVGWTLLSINSCSAPKGRLDECRKIALTIRFSSRATLPFYNRYMQVTRLLQDQAYAQIYQAGQISRIISQTNDQISKTISESYWSQQKANDGINQHFSDYIRGVDRYSDGSGAVYQLPSGYANAWVNNKGEYLVSDQAGFDPGTALQEEWKPLQKH